MDKRLVLNYLRRCFGTDARVAGVHVNWIAEATCSSIPMKSLSMPTNSAAGKGEPVGLARRHAVAPAPYEILLYRALAKALVSAPPIGSLSPGWRAVFGSSSSEAEWAASRP